MRKKTFSLVLILFCFFIQHKAQVDETCNPFTGPAFSIFLIDSASATEGAGGSGRFWDFSFAGYQSVTYQQQVLNVSATPEGQNFPNADLALYNSFHQRFEYFSVSDSAFVWNGTFDNQTEYIVNFDDPAESRRYPMTLGTSFTDTYSGNVYDGSQYIARHGIVAVHCDGEGVLRDRNFNLSYPVYRVRTEWTDNDSIDNGDGTWLLRTIGRVEYEFLQPGVSQPLARVEYYYESGSYRKYFFLLSRPAVSNEPLLNATPQFRIFPNPSKGEAKLILPENGTVVYLEIFNSLGEIMAVSQEFSVDGMVNLPEFSSVPGVYFVKVVNGKQNMSVLPWIKN